MTKQNVFIVLSHKHSLKPRTKEWETSEQIEFVSQLRNKHISMSTAIADFVNKKMLSGTRYGITSYNDFVEYIEKKYPKQLAELQSKYGSLQVKEELPVQSAPSFVDQFGNARAKTVFDV